MCVSPVAENKVFVKYDDNPFHHFFARGMLVALSTDNPVLQHVTDEPLMEEFSVAAQMYSLSECDLSELAVNSVMLSGFSDPEKRRWLGPEWDGSKKSIGASYNEAVAFTTNGWW